MGNHFAIEIVLIDQWTGVKCKYVLQRVIMQEKEAKDIEIPNIKWNVFELMIRYFGTVHFLTF